LLRGPAGIGGWGVTGPWGRKRSGGARTHGGQLARVGSRWIQLDRLTGQPFAEFRDTLARATPTGMQLMAIVTNAVGGRFHPNAVRQLAADRTALATAAGEVARRVAAAHYRGM